MSLDTPSTPEPEEDQIASMLQQIRPMPGRRFYQKMESMPWMKPVASSGLSPRLFLGRLFASPRRAAAVLGLVLICIATGVLTIPSVRATARQFFMYFLAAPGDTRSVQVTVPGNGSQVIGDSHYFSQTLLQVQQKVDFPIYEIRDLPAGMTLQGAHYDSYRQAAILNYTNGVDSIWLTERRQGNLEEYSSIGASATVEAISIQGVQGEFVRGGWRVAPASQIPLATSTPGAQLTIGVYWDPGYPQFTLRWQESGIVLDLTYIGNLSSEKATLLRIAESIK